MTIKARIRALEKVLAPTEADIREMTDEQLMRIVGCSPIQKLTDAELEAIIRGTPEELPNGKR